MDRGIYQHSRLAYLVAEMGAGLKAFGLSMARAEAVDKELPLLLSR